MTPRTSASRPRLAALARQQGSFMLEALIGILIFSLGVLGLVALQAQSMRHVAEAQYRGEAVYLANSVISQMWADNPASLAAKYQSGGAGYLAFRELVKRLPGGDASRNAPVITVAPGPSNGSSLITVSVFWNSPGQDETNPECGSTGQKCQHNYTTTAVVGLN